MYAVGCQLDFSNCCRKTAPRVAYAAREEPEPKKCAGHALAEHTSGRIIQISLNFTDVLREIEVLKPVSRRSVAQCHVSCAR